MNPCNPTPPNPTPRTLAARLLRLAAAVAALLLAFAMATVQAQETRFTYQGELRAADLPASGAHDLRFTLYDSVVGGGPLSDTLTLDDVVVSDGVFSVALDFGLDPFDGGALYLQVEVRPGNDSGAYTVLSPRQAITAAPYALHAQQVGLMAVGPDQLQPGAVGASAIDASEVQRRITGACPAGQAVASIGGDGALACIPVPSAEDIGAALNPLPSGQEVILETSGTGNELTAVLGAHGGVLVAWYNPIDGNLEFVACLDIDCIERDRRTLDSAGVTGRWPSMALRRNGLPVISYYRVTSGDLRLIDCGDPTCTTFTRITVASNNDVGGHSAIATLGNHVMMLYYNFTFQDLEYVRCSGTPLCSTRIDATIASTGDVGRPAALVSTGLFNTQALWMAWRNSTASRVEWMRCNTAVDNCIGPVAIPGTTNTDLVSMTMGADHQPLMALLIGPTCGAVQFRHCSDPDCQTVSSSTNNSTACNAVPSVDVLPGADGYPLSLAGAAFSRCPDMTCTGRNTHTSGSSLHGGRLVLDREGRAGVVFNSINSLRYRRCTNRACDPNLPPQ